ncbi:MAG: hypothetical protein GVY36_06505 [Verrucomicrobia bacterium]|nr:hypothetical protein [Verrucomicrobiota bacterium]
MESQEMCRCYREHEEELAAHRPKLEDERKDELKALLASQSASSKSGE